MASRADLPGWRLGGGSLAVIPFGIAAANVIEGAVFLKSTLAWGRLFLLTTLSYVLVAPVWGWIFTEKHAGTMNFHPVEAQGFAARAWRFLASDCAYFALYMIAGILIFPLVRDFYANTDAAGVRRPGRAPIAGARADLRGHLPAACATAWKESRVGSRAGWLAVHFVERCCAPVGTKPSISGRCPLGSFRRGDFVELSLCNDCGLALGSGH